MLHRAHSRGLCGRARRILIVECANPRVECDSDDGLFGRLRECGNIATVACSHCCLLRRRLLVSVKCVFQHRLDAFNPSFVHPGFTNVKSNLDNSPSTCEYDPMARTVAALNLTSRTEQTERRGSNKLSYYRLPFASFRFLNARTAARCPQLSPQYFRA